MPDKNETRFPVVTRHSLEWKLLDIYEMPEKLRAFSSIYIYGPGMVGKNMLAYLTEYGMYTQIAAFLVSEPIGHEKSIGGVKILHAAKAVISANDAVLLAGKKGIRGEMAETCEMLGISNVIEINVFDDRDYDYYSALPEIAYPLELKDWYTRVTGKQLNLENPQTFNEKINWMKLYDRDPRKTRLADKYQVREYVKEKIGEEYLVPLLGVWDSYNEIDFGMLPNRFVLKCNHGCGWNVIVRDKSKLDIKRTKKKFDGWIKQNYAFIYGLELHYKSITPKIVAETYLCAQDDNIVDYRFFCFNGSPKYVWVDAGSGTENHKRSIFNLDWKEQDCLVNYQRIVPTPLKPKTFDEMVHIASALSQNFAFVRVDLYSIYGKVYFGEMTFTPQSGAAHFCPEEYDACMGEYLEVS